MTIAEPSIFAARTWHIFTAVIAAAIIALELPTWIGQRHSAAILPSFAAEAAVDTAFALATALTAIWAALAPQLAYRRHMFVCGSYFAASLAGSVIVSHTSFPLFASLPWRTMPASLPALLGLVGAVGFGLAPARQTVPN